MRILITLCLLVFLSCGGNKKIPPTVLPQKVNHEADVKKKLDLYMGKMMAGDYEAALDMAYPKLFEIVPKETMLGVFKQAFGDENMKITFSDHEILKIYDNYIEVDNKVHTLVDYNLSMNMKLKGEMADAAGFMIPSFEEQFGKENVIYNEEESSFLIKMKNQMIAVKDAGEWYFLENKKEQAFILEKIFGKETLEKLGAKKM